MATTEHTTNDALAAALRQTRKAWRDSNIVISENTSVLKGTAERPDILVLEPNVSPVVIETEFIPAVTVEKDAVSRLGKVIRTTGRTILSSVAVRLPATFKNKQGTKLYEDISNTRDLEVATFTGSSPTTATRWPISGWIRMSIAELSVLTQSASIPPAVIEAAADELVNGVSEAAGLLDEIATRHSGAMSNIARELRQEDGVQTRRMAATILSNAFMFQDNLASGPGELSIVNSLEQLRGAGKLTKSGVLAEWRKILKVNYWPIFDIARRILEPIPTQDSKPLIAGLTTTADKLLENQLMHSHDLTGAVFQRLIADRKFLAAYYTTPASAALLVGLALDPLKSPAVLGPAKTI